KDFPMLRWCSRLAARPLLPLLALTACALLVSGPSSPTLCGEVPVVRIEPVNVPDPAAEYTLQDGTILEGGQAKTADDGRPAAPGKVDTLDIQKAYERANKLAGQAKGRVFKT